MTKSTKKVEKTTEKTTKVINKDSLLKVLDWVAKIVAGVFFIACTYGYVSGWLKTHQNNYDLSRIGAILVVSVALYLFLRKK
jgi:hypothetical protein